MKVNVTLSIDKKVYLEIKELKMFQNLSKFTNQIFINHIEEYKRKQLIATCKKRSINKVLLDEMEELAVPIYADLEKNFSNKEGITKKNDHN